MATARLFSSAGVRGRSKRDRMASLSLLFRGRGTTYTRSYSTRTGAEFCVIPRRGGKRRHSCGPLVSATVTQNDSFTSNSREWTSRETLLATALGIGTTAGLTLKAMNDDQPTLNRKITEFISKEIVDKVTDTAATGPTLKRRITEFISKEVVEKVTDTAATGESSAAVATEEGLCKALEEIVSEQTFELGEQSPLLSSFQERYNASVGMLQGDRQYMEDRCYVGDDGRFVAVFDGHGGSCVSTFLQERLYDTVTKYLWQEQPSMKHWMPSLEEQKRAIRSAFDEMDREVLEIDDLHNQGSTAVAVAMHQDPDGQKTIISANVGDSRAILSRDGRAVNLTRDHKPNCEVELARIRSIGETIEWDYEDRIYRINDLAVSRSIGDRFAKPAVSGEVEIMSLPIQDDRDEFVVLASDGLWDVMSSQDVVYFIHDTLRDASDKAEVRDKIPDLLTKEAWMLGSGDNICVALVWLK